MRSSITTPAASSALSAHGPAPFEARARRPGRRAPRARRSRRAVYVERPAAHWALLQRFVARHLAEGTTLRSFPFLVNALERR